MIGLTYLDYLETNNQSQNEQFSFGFFLKDPLNIHKSLEVNGLLKKYIDQDLKFQEVIRSQDGNNQFFISLARKEVTKIAVFKEGFLEKLLIVAFMRTSYHNPDQSAVLYEIVFSKIKDVLPELRVFRIVDNELRYTHHSNMQLVAQEGMSKSYACLVDTPLEISLTMLHTELQMAVSVFDRAKHEIFSVTSASLIKQYTKRLHAYFECIALLSHVQSMQKMLAVYFLDTIEELEEDPATYEQVLIELARDAKVLNNVLNCKHWVHKNNLPINAKDFFEKVLLRGFLKQGRTLDFEASEVVNSSTCVFIQKNQERLQLVKRLEILNDTVIEEAVEDMRLLQQKYPNTRGNKVEFIVCQEAKPLLSCDEIYKLISRCEFARFHVDTVYFAIEEGAKLQYFTYRIDKEGVMLPCHHLHNVHPIYYDYLELQRFSKFDLVQENDAMSAPHFLFFASAKKGGKLKDERLIGFSLIDHSDHEKALLELLAGMKQAQDANKEKILVYNRMVFQCKATESKEAFAQSIALLVEKHWLALQEASVEKILFRFTLEDSEFLLEIKNILYNAAEYSVSLVQSEEECDPVRLATAAEQRELQLASKGGTWAYRVPAIISSVAAEFRKKELGEKSEAIVSSFVELDLDHTKTIIDKKTGSIDYNYGQLIEVTRPIGHNEAGVIVGIKTDDLGIGKPVRRILIVGDLTHSSRGAIRAQECARVNAAIKYAAERKMPIDWFTASYGVQVHREKGVEGLDAAASTLREIVHNCHHKGVQINLVIDETNIGAQSYWDSMATILNETSGILIMTPKGCMALTGPSALVSALYRTVHSEELPQYTKTLYPNGLQTLSGYETIHGPNSDSTLFAKDFKEACYLLLKHHYFSYLDPKEKLTASRPQHKYIDETRDAATIEAAHLEIDNFLKGLKPNREVILDYIKDKDTPDALRLWSDIKGIRGQTFKNGDLPQAPSTIVKEMLIGGFPTFVIFTATGPLTPTDAEIIARGIYKASGRMQVLIIGSLSGFSCDPLSMENRQLLAGSYIAKAIIEHDGPMLIVNLGNLVGGTFAVFNKQLNRDVRILAIEGARVQVLGGKAAAKVVFHSQICKRADEDPRVLQDVLRSVKSDSKSPTDEIIQRISVEKLGEIRNQVIIELEDKEAEAFDRYHNAQRAVQVGSIDQIISFENLRGSIILAFEEMRAKYLKKIA